MQVLHFKGYLSIKPALIFVVYIPFTCRDTNMNSQKLMRLIIGGLVIVAMMKFFLSLRWELQFSKVVMYTNVSMHLSNQASLSPK